MELYAGADLISNSLCKSSIGLRAVAEQAHIKVDSVSLAPHHA